MLAGVYLNEYAGDNWATRVVNLAVVNFLPIPLLDGGHMVFLIYEKIRGKPASEQVRNIAAYIGLGLLLALMVFVFVNDIRKSWF